MKKQFWVLLSLLVSTNCFSQISFEPGYYIDNNSQKITGLVKNVDWKNNPSQFSFKASEDAEEMTLSINSVAEFGIYDNMKYVRHNVDIDKSGKNLGQLSNSKDPVFEKEVLFLEVLVEGKASLYSYQSNNLKRFFFSKDGSGVEQLIYKTYNTPDKKVEEMKNLNSNYGPA